MVFDNIKPIWSRFRVFEGHYQLHTELHELLPAHTSFWNEGHWEPVLAFRNFFFLKRMLIDSLCFGNMRTQSPNFEIQIAFWHKEPMGKKTILIFVHSSNLCSNNKKREVNWHCQNHHEWVFLVLLRKCSLDPSLWQYGVLICVAQF